MANKEVFIKAIKENERLIYKVASIYTDCTDDRDDLVQEIIYNLWKSFEQFKQNSSLSTWMYRVAMNVSIYYLKKNKRQADSVAIDSEVLNIKDTDKAEIDDNLRNLQKHIANLNLLDKGIVMLYLENKSHEEIASITGLSKSNVGTKLNRIKEKLKVQLVKTNDYGIR